MPPKFFAFILAALVAPLKAVILGSSQTFLNQFENNLQGVYKNGTIRPHYYHQNGPQHSTNYGGSHVSDDETFDFIVVGSGSAGSVLANRLSEVPQWKVLLLEVGEEATSLTDIPVIAPAFQFTNYDWAYKMQKQDGACLGCPNQTMHWPRGRALGGTTIINFMINVRGNPIDYQRWEAMGNPGWGWKDVLPYFKKMEDANIKIQDPGYHQKGGNLAVSDVPFRTKFVEAYVKAAQESGMKYVDYNGRNQLGISYVQSTTKNGKRWSAERAYLEPAARRPNLRIVTKAYVVKVLIDPATKTAYGVRYSKNKRYFDVRAKKEVILSAGAFNSPQLLMLSGVGPKRHLQELGIDVLVDLPVGQKLYDHITFVGMNFEINDSLAVLRQEQLEDPRIFVELFLRGMGPLTSIGAVEALGYIKTNASTDKENYPDIEMIIAGTSLNADKGLIYKNTLSVSQEVYDAVWKPLEGKPVFLVLLMLVHPKSVGYMKLKSKNPFHRPLLYGNFFTDPENHDIKTFISGIRETQRINESPALKKLGSKPVKYAVPGCSSLRYDSDEFWECALRHNSPTLHHQVSTCKMGPSNDAEAVVDPKLRVYGVSNLRVVDTSVIPLPLTAHTSTPAYMIGEKAADIIKKEWGHFDNTLDKADIRRHV